MACGIIRRAEDFSGYGRVVVSSCVHGHSVCAWEGVTWSPRPETPVPICPRCHARVHRDRGGAIDGQPAHLKCSVPTRWSPVRLAMFAADWNRGVPTTTLRDRYGLAKHGIDGLVARLRWAGTPMTPRTHNSGRYQRASRRPSPLTRQTHALAAAGAFKRNQLGARA